ncbi:MAG: GDP-L-fucose synthase, partial [Thermodesulfobacteriota bacterium]
GIVLGTLNYDKEYPVNLGTGQEIKIKDLVNMIKDLVGFEGKLIWNKSKPDGQPRRMLDTSLAEKEFGFKSSTSFQAGLEKTINWFANNFTDN